MTTSQPRHSALSHGPSREIAKRPSPAKRLGIIFTPRSFLGLPSPTPDQLAQRRERVFLVFAGLFLGTLVMLNLLGISRFLVLASYGPAVEGGPWLWQWAKPNFISNWTFAVAVGVLPYPVTFLCTDLISEFYGRKRANFLVLVGLLLNVWLIAILWVGGMLPGFVENDPVTAMPPPPQWNPETGAYAETGWTFYQIRFLTLGAVFASMIAYLVAQFVDVQLFHFWKKLTQGKHLWLRNNGSTIVSQLVDSFAVITITHFYAHALPIDSSTPIWPQLWLFIATGFAFKLVIALLDTPLIYLAVAVLRRYLRLDPTTPSPGNSPGNSHPGSSHPGGEAQAIRMFSDTND